MPAILLGVALATWAQDDVPTASSWIWYPERPAVAIR
jgi:hypothetical protein